MIFNYNCLKVTYGEKKAVLHNCRIHSPFAVLQNMSKNQCVNIVQIPSFFCSYFPVCRLDTDVYRENTWKYGCYTSRVFSVSFTHSQLAWHLDELPKKCQTWSFFSFAISNFWTEYVNKENCYLDTFYAAIHFNDFLETILWN